MFPLKNKRSRNGIHAVKDGICPHCGEVRPYKICYIALENRSHLSTMWTNSIFYGIFLVSSTTFIFQWKQFVWK